MTLDPRSLPNVHEIAADLALENPSTLGECPVWDERENVLYWVDIAEGHLHRFDPPSQTNTTRQLPTKLSSIGKRAKGGLIATLRKTFAIIDGMTGRCDVLDTVEADQPDNRFNDGKIDRKGRYWAGTMNEVEIGRPDAALYCFRCPGDVQKMIPEVTISNGTGWSPDGLTMYYTDTLRFAVFAYDFDPASGAIANRRVFAAFEPSANGLPDGLTVDAEGFVWSALVNHGRVLRFDPNGTLERIVTFPPTRGTCPTFGGPTFDTLYITTARETLTPAQIAAQPLAGSLFACTPGPRGIPEPMFAG
jgi:sugar lactone lactonase YvrE